MTMNRKTLIHSLILGPSLGILLLLLSFCSNTTQPPTGKPLSFSKIQTVKCKADTSQSYMVYLPTLFQEKLKWPVLFMFDSHADGLLAVEKAKTAAETYGYILVGSNNSKNGATNIEQILNVLYNDVTSRFPVDENRIYAAGFSGGGRVAQEFAISSGKIKGIITCSAGLSNFNPQNAVHKFDIYGIAGLEDFNNDEVLAIPKQFNNAGWRTAVSTFNGGHAWPPEENMIKALQWFELNAMKDNTLKLNKASLQVWFDSAMANVVRLLKEKQYMLASQDCENAISQFQTLTSTKKLEKKLTEIKSLEAYQLEMNKEQKLKFQEQELRNGYAQSFIQEDTTWWRNEIQNLNTEISTDKDLLYHQMLCRIRGFLGIICYSYTSNVISSGRLSDAEKFIHIYEILEPENPDCFFYKAMLFDKKGNTHQAVFNLKKALEKGLSDRAKIQQSFSEKVLKQVIL
jgi:dienelactone hydrolase